MKPITAVLFGAGNRGTVYGDYALRHPEEIQFIAVADPDAERRAIFAKAHNIPADMCFNSWEDALAPGKIADCAFIATQDNNHYHPAMLALDKGYDLMLEKPIACTAKECDDIYKKSVETGHKVCICHVLRHTQFYGRVKQILNSGVLGQVTHILMRENVGIGHMSHSYVRGNWRREEDSNPMLLAKCCHDLDLLLWFAEEKCQSVSSFGTQTYFNEKNAPADAPARCLDGCPHAHDCYFYAPRLYHPNSWLSQIITPDVSKENLMRILKTSPYGRCVFHCDNTVVDHQTVSMNFADGMNATLIMSGFTPKIDREIYILGTKGELRGLFGAKQTITVTDFLSGNKTEYTIPLGEGGHGGGDEGLMHDFVRLMREPDFENSSDIYVSIQSHLLGYAAEHARHSQTVVDFESFCNTL